MPRNLTLVILGLLFTAQTMADVFQGRLEWARRVDLATTVDGIVREVLVRPGQVIPQGEVLVRLDTGEYRARALAAEAKVTRARPAFEEAERELERAQALYERTVLSDHDLQKAQITFASARADLDEALAERMEAEVHLERTGITAPFDAIVLAVSAVPGQVVVNRLRPHPLVTVADGRSMSIRLAVPADRIGALSVGRNAYVTVEEITYTGTITEIGLEPSDDETYPVVVEFEFDGAPPQAGRSAWVDFS